MKAMILAAGRGKRMSPLTDTTPKPLLKVGNKSLIEHHLQALAKADIREVVINISYLGEQIRHALGDGSRYGLTIQYSFEETALETGGGIYKALPLLGDETFLVISADIWCQIPYVDLIKKDKGLAHLVLVDNPDFHPQGDFVLHEGKLYLEGTQKYNFSGVALYHPELFKACQAGYFPIIDVLRPAIEKGKVSGEYYSGPWVNVGTPKQLEELNRLTTEL